MKSPIDSRWIRHFGKPWIRLENASKIFLATFNAVDTKVYRFTVELYEEVDREKLQWAVEQAYDSFDLYRATIRRGFFWYYFEETDLRPVVSYENQVPCSLLYHHEYRGLLFRVLYRKKRIHLEVFHALSDGNGALRFFRNILAAYFSETKPLWPDTRSPIGPGEHMTDAFKRTMQEEEPLRITQLIRSSVENLFRNRTKPAPLYHITGMPTVDGRMKVIEMQCSTEGLLALSRSYHASVTVFLTALFIRSIYRSIPADRSQGVRISVEIPVDLRQFFPSETARNFFGTIKVDYDFTKNPDELMQICASITAQFQQKITREKMLDKLRQLLLLEESLALRWILRPIKDGILRFANRVNRTRVTAAMTNTGRLYADETFQDRIHMAGIMTAAVRPQFSVLSHGGILTITFTSPFQEDLIQHHFYDKLQEQGVAVALYGNHVYGDAEKQTLALDRAPYPYVSPRYDTRKALLYLGIASVVILLLGMAVKGVFPHSILSLRFILVLIAGLWAVGWTLFTKRRNPNKALLYQFTIFSGFSLLWDFLSGWRGWSIHYAIPFIVITATVAALISARVSVLKMGDKLLYIQGIVLLGLIPFVLSLFNWVDPAWPSQMASSISFLILLYTAIKYRQEVRNEISKRFHL